MKNLYSIEIDDTGLIISTSFPSTYFLEDEIPRIGINFSEFWDDTTNQKIKEFIENIFTGTDICEFSFKTNRKSIYCIGSKHSKNKAFVSLKYINLETESERWGFDELPLEKRLVANQPITFYDNLKKFTENLPLVIFEIFLYPDGRFKFGFVNKEMENFFPLFNREAVNADNNLLFVRVHPEDKQKLMDSIYNVFKFNVWDIEYRVVEDGQTRWVRGYGRPEINEEYNYIKVCTYLQDITENKRVEEEKEILLEELTKNNKELNQFNYITTHNLRASLTNLVSICNLIKTDKIEDDLTKKFIENFKISTNYLNETLNDLIKILIVKENTNLSTEELDFQENLDKVKASVNMKLLNEGVILDVDFTKAPKVFFSSIYLESIFLNLITNAIKYRHHDRAPVIKIRTSKEENGTIKLIFSDNGIGMNMERVRNKIFGLYQRFHSNSDSKGIGLYLVHSQITTMGGKISVDSEENVGTTFTINFK